LADDRAVTTSCRKRSTSASTSSLPTTFAPTGLTSPQIEELGAHSLGRAGAARLLNRAEQPAYGHCPRRPPPCGWRGPSAARRGLLVVVVPAHLLYHPAPLLKFLEAAEGRTDRLPVMDTHPNRNTGILGRSEWQHHRWMRRPRRRGQCCPQRGAGSHGALWCR